MWCSTADDLVHSDDFRLAVMKNDLKLIESFVKHGKLGITILLTVFGTEASLDLLCSVFKEMHVHPEIRVRTHRTLFQSMDFE